MASEVLRAEQFVTGRRWRALGMAVAGLALLAGGFAGFGVYSDRLDSIQKNGVHTTATVTDAVLYHRASRRNGFREHIDISYPYPTGVARNARIWIGERDRYAVGQLVPIAYDPHHPEHAVLANGSPDIVRSERCSSSPSSPA